MTVNRKKNAIYILTKTICLTFVYRSLLLIHLDLLPQSMDQLDNLLVAQASLCFHEYGVCVLALLNCDLHFRHLCQIFFLKNLKFMNLLRDDKRSLE